jgi:hypothetical protein
MPVRINPTATLPMIDLVDASMAVTAVVLAV